ncbi:MAG: hypothetical protein LC793_05145, partial [Thermomicrobia bacterium]|nr:hypothetical protein [Thermomicrobia bacterium]MCA1724694.1 hypothetical protein [Thermomicrobia bacterium]
LYDVGYQNYGRFAGGVNAALGNLFPEYDPNYPIQRIPTDDGGYEYYMRSLNSIAQWGEMHGGQPDSTYTYQSDSNNNKAYVELTERGLYAATVGKFKRNDQPHYQIEVETEWGYKTPRAADMVTVDYTGYGYANGIYFNRLRVNDLFYAMKCERTFNTEITDKWTLSNLGRYTPNPVTSQNTQTARQVAAMQMVTNTALSVSILGTTYRELDAGNNPKANATPADHSIIYPIKILPTCFQVQAAYFRVDFLPFRQTVFEAEGGTHTHTINIPPHEHAPPTGLTTDNALIGGMPPHNHQLLFLGTGQTGIPIDDKTNYISALIKGTDLLFLVNALNGIYKAKTSGQILLPDLKPTDHPHTFVKTTKIADTHAFDPFETDVLTTSLAGLHTHQLTPMIQDTSIPAAIQVWIDGGDGAFVNRTAELIDLTQNQGTTVAAGFTNSFEFECARFIDAPGRTVRLKFVSIGNTSNPYGLGALGISGTIAASYGGLGQSIRQQQ